MTKSPRRVAFLDDSLTARVVLKNILTDAGHEPLCCETWEQLDEVVTNQKLDLVLLDVQMPGVSGPPIAYVLKKRQPELKVVYYSSAEDAMLRRLTEETGADGYIRKSFDGDEVAQAIDRHLAIEPSSGDSK